MCVLDRSTKRQREREERCRKKSGKRTETGKER